MCPKEIYMENTDPSGFVLLTDIVPDVVLDIRYHSTYNFMGERVDGYEEPVALITKEAASALKAVSDEAVSKGYRLKIFDCYRPQMAVDHFIRWAGQHKETAMKHYFYPDVDKEKLFELGFVASRSSHSRGSTVDLTLLDMDTQKDLDVGGTFDYFGQLSWSQYTDTVSELQVKNRLFLRELMVSHGFRPLAEEWWHFTLDNEPYPDTYFTFPVNSNQVRKKESFSDKLNRDMEFRFRYFDEMAKSSERTKTIINTAAKEAFEIARTDIRNFANRENVELNERNLDSIILKLSSAINNAITELLIFDHNIGEDNTSLPTKQKE